MYKCLSLSNLDEHRKDWIFFSDVNEMPTRKWANALYQYQTINPSSVTQT